MKWKVLTWICISMLSFTLIKTLISINFVFIMGRFYTKKHRDDDSWLRLIFTNYRFSTQTPYICDWTSSYANIQQQFLQFTTWFFMIFEIFYTYCYQLVLSTPFWIEYYWRSIRLSLRVFLYWALRIFCHMSMFSTERMCACVCVWVCVCVWERYHVRYAIIVRRTMLASLTVRRNNNTK